VRIDRTPVTYTYGSSWSRLGSVSKHGPILRPMEQSDRGEVADLIYVSMNYSRPRMGGRLPSAAARKPPSSSARSTRRSTRALHRRRTSNQRPPHGLPAFTASARPTSRSNHERPSGLLWHRCGKTLLRFVCDPLGRRRESAAPRLEPASLDSFSRTPMRDSCLGSSSRR